MKWKRLESAQSEGRYKQMLDSGRFVADDDLPRDMRALGAGLRTAVQFTEADSEFERDLKAAFALYTLLPPERLGLRNAADDGVWRFLSLKVIPDIVHQRAGPNEQWFWRSRRKWRLWVKRMWWFAHLTWQGDETRTRAVTTSMTTDSLSQLVERAGSAGFRVELCREIARQHLRSDRRSALRKALKLNTAFLVTVEPELSEGGVEGYVRRLYATARGR